MHVPNPIPLGVCPGCFGSAKWVRTVGVLRTRCSRCGEREWTGIKRLWQVSERAAVDGYLYPLLTDRGPATKRYSLIPDPVVTWLALAVLSGVAGNLTYDLLKVAFRRITRRHRKLRILSRGSTDVNTGRITIGRELQLSVMLSDSELSKCEARLRRYFVGRSGRLNSTIELVRKARIGLEVRSDRAPTSGHSITLRQQPPNSRLRRTGQRAQRKPRR